MNRSYRQPRSEHRLTQAILLVYKAIDLLEIFKNFQEFSRFASNTKHFLCHVTIDKSRRQPHSKHRLTQAILLVYRAVDILKN